MGRLAIMIDPGDGISREAITKPRRGAIWRAVERAVIGLGTNLGDREENLLASAAWIEDEPGIELAAISPVYGTAPLGPALHPFLNAAALVETTLEPAALMRRLQACERRAGRPGSRERWGPRVLDLDVLVMGERVRRDPPPVIPHPGLLERDFALRPLLDLVPDLCDPSSGERLAGVLERLEHRTILSGPGPLPSEVDYRLVDHAADAGMEVRGADLERLMAAASMALSDAVVPRGLHAENQRIDVDVEAPDVETLLVGLMQEVLYLLDTRGFLPVRSRVRIDDAGPGLSLRASLYGSGIEPSWVRLPVKAATHHGLEVGCGDCGWTARVLLDV
jgi:2-amino-4-hydroxy-6-hydroxymethyldihydropteridine diphosphokinase